MRVRLFRTTTLFVLAFAIDALSPAFAQSVLSREVGPEAADVPLVIRSVTGQNIGRIAKAADVPMGLETARGTGPRGFNVVASKRTLREVLDDIVAQDPRYQWREMDGVIVLRPVLAWYDRMNPLVSAVDPFALDDITSADALGVLRQFFGIEGGLGSGPGDTTVFSAALPPGGSLLEALNAIVRGHGTLAWALDPPRTTSSTALPMMFSLFIGANGTGFGVPDGTHFRRRAVVEKPQPRAQAGGTALDRVIGLYEHGEPLTLYGPWSGSIDDLARMTGIPMGFESLPAGAARIDREGVPSIRVSGLSARQALDAVCALDPRYEWREMGNVVVIRPTDAWNDPTSRLFRVLDAEPIDNVPVGQAISVVGKAVGGFERAGDGFPDARRITLRPAGATILDFLNALVDAHGAMTWHWGALSPQDAKESGFRYEIGFTLLRGSGHGFKVP